MQEQFCSITLPNSFSSNNNTARCNQVVFLVAKMLLFVEMAKMVHLEVANMA